MLNTLIGLSLALHGMVHLLYFGQSARLFALQPGMRWPVDSWAFARLLGEQQRRTLAGTLCLLAGVGFWLGAAGLLLDQAWTSSVLLAAAMLSILLYTLFWDGRSQHLDNQGGIGVLLDLGIVAGLCLMH